MTNQVIIDLHISAEEFLKLYSGQAKNANALARDGRRIRFPAHILRPFVTHDGVQGSFIIVFDENMKFSSIRRL
ncbi:hypothetical protein TDB9533_01286 [Thalassocella blandensis]|nr:hypothetical protein TDB9533_01286 [Thalassocella blandensis]